ncbi:MAG: S1 RNA-binding domain-containing protein, partial [Planctomycetes bacterium]|nr:S1 RNA-binding domain-containing protein [Planctomycetota bacterium]
MGRRRRGGQNRVAGGRRLLINARESAESRIAILEGGRLEEYYIERGSLGSTLGNIYKARVTNVEKSIGAAFVDFGHARQGFLHVSDLCMAAVTESARSLLADVQAARESAHDDDVVEVGPPPEADAPPAPDATSAVEDIPHGPVAEAEASAAGEDGDDGDDGDEDGLEAAAPGFDVAVDLDAEPDEEGPGEAAAGPNEPAESLEDRKAESLAFAKGGGWEEDDGAEEGEDEGENGADGGDGVDGEAEAALSEGEAPAPAGAGREAGSGATALAPSPGTEA